MHRAAHGSALHFFGFSVRFALEWSPYVAVALVALAVVLRWPRACATLLAMFVVGRAWRWWSVKRERERTEHARRIVRGLAASN